MTRAIFGKGKLNQYLSQCQATTNLSLPQLAKAISVERHTLNDWRRGRNLPNLEKLSQLAHFTKIPLPKYKNTKPEYWACSAASIRMHQIYGCTLTHEDRVKAGTNSQQRRRENPACYSSLGCNVARTFALPVNKSKGLAELTGILLGDGGIQPAQFTIALNSIKDKEYALYVKTLIEKLFFYSPRISKRRNCNALAISVSGVDIINYLIGLGLRVGNKVRQQVDVPDWIKNNAVYSRWCLRGLMDTDGGIFVHTYTINRKSYHYLKTNFTNASLPLLAFVDKILKENGFHPNNKRYRKVWLYSQPESRRYLEVIGSSNERLLRAVR